MTPNRILVALLGVSIFPLIKLCQIMRLGRKATGLNSGIEPALDALSRSEKDSRAAEFDIVNVKARAVRLFYYYR